jgi:hypothetical protein
LRIAFFRRDEHDERRDETNDSDGKHSPTEKQEVGGF